MLASFTANRLCLAIVQIHLPDSLAMKFSFKKPGCDEEPEVRVVQMVYYGPALHVRQRALKQHHPCESATEKPTCTLFERLPRRTLMLATDSVVQWIAEVKEGDWTHVPELWERYFPKLVEHARQQLRGVPCRVADEEDVVLSVLNRFCIRAQRGCLPDVTDRDGLWGLLLKMTTDKAIDLVRRQQRKCRGGGRVRGESGFQGEKTTSDLEAFAQVRGDTPTPQTVLMMNEEFRRLLEMLKDPELVAIALAKLEGHSNSEIAVQLNCAVRTVERRLLLIRKNWEQEVPR